MKDLSKIIGRDIRQAERYAEGLDAAVERLKKELESLESSKVLITGQLERKTLDAGDAWAYISHLKKVN